MARLNGFIVGIAILNLWKIIRWQASLALIRGVENKQVKILVTTNNLIRPEME